MEPGSLHQTLNQSHHRGQGRWAFDQHPSAIRKGNINPACTDRFRGRDNDPWRGWVSCRGQFQLNERRFLLVARINWHSRKPGIFQPIVDHIGIRRIPARRLRNRCTGKNRLRADLRFSSSDQLRRFLRLLIKGP